jgi:hypothetical protein
MLGGIMELNEDGLIPGQPVDFETIMRLSRKAKTEETKNESAEEAKPAARRGRKPVAKDDGAEVGNQPHPESADQA